MSSIKIVVFHPMQQHSFQTAIAIKKSGYFHGYWTSIYYNPQKFLYKFLNRFLNKKEKDKMHSHYCEFIDKDVTCFCILFGFLFLLLSRIDKTKSKFFKLKSKDILVNKIGKKVARAAIKQGVDYIITYDTWSYGLIKELKKRKSTIKIIMDCSSLYAEEIREILLKDIEYNKFNAGAYKSIMEQFSLKYIKKFRYEKDNSNYFLSPSKIVDSSFIKYGVDISRIFRCTYGSNFEHVEYVRKNNDKTTFIYIGRLSYAKGVHYLLKAFDELCRDDYCLLLVGADVDGISKRIANKNIKYVGLVSHDKISDLLSLSDVIITASLYDSFSLALLEGAAYNLPILCTLSTGASDYIKNGENGFTFKSFDSQAIREKLCLILEKKCDLSLMSKNAGRIVENLTWENYYKDIKLSIEDIIKKEK